MREIEEMGAGELAEWIGRIRTNPWGRHRTEQLHLQAMMFAVLGNNHSDPGELLRGLRLPWEPKKEQQLSLEQMRAFLLSIGGKPGGG